MSYANDTYEKMTVEMHKDREFLVRLFAADLFSFFFIQNRTRNASPLPVIRGQRMGEKEAECPDVHCTVVVVSCVSLTQCLVCDRNYSFESREDMAA